MDVARFAQQRAHYHAGAIYLLPKLRIKKVARSVWYSGLDLHQVGSPTGIFYSPGGQYTIASYTVGGGVLLLFLLLRLRWKGST